MHARSFGTMWVVMLGALVTVSLGACASANKAEAPTKAVPVTGWDGVKNVSRSGRITFAGQPNQAALQKFAREGGATVIDLRTHEGADTPAFDERAQVESLKMKYVNISIKGAALNTGHVDALAQCMSETNGPILIHCASSNRVGALWAAYLALKTGMPQDEAIAQGKAAGMSSPEVEKAARDVIGR